MWCGYSKELSSEHPKHMFEVKYMYKKSILILYLILLCLYAPLVFQIKMPGNQFQREIKRSGYLKGTSMKRVRNKFLGVIFAFTFASYGIS